LRTVPGARDVYVTAFGLDRADIGLELVTPVVLGRAIRDAYGLCGFDLGAGHAKAGRVTVNLVAGPVRPPQ
jgi:hypothetical protein